MKSTGISKIIFPERVWFTTPQGWTSRPATKHDTARRIALGVYLGWKVEIRGFAPQPSKEMIQGAINEI